MKKAVVLNCMMNRPMEVPQNYLEKHLFNVFLISEVTIKMFCSNSFMYDLYGSYYAAMIIQLPLGLKKKSSCPLSGQRFCLAILYLLKVFI